MHTSGQRLAIVLSHPTQYYSPWFRWLRSHTSLEFRVFYLWQFGVTAQHDPQFQKTFSWDVDLLSGYEHEFVPNISRDPGTHHFAGLRNPLLIARLTAWKPSALLLFGYKWSSHLRAIYWGRSRGIPLLFRGDSHLLGRGAPPWPSRILLRILFAQFRAFLAVGAANRDYFTTLGAPARKIIQAPHSINHALFDPKLDAHRTAVDALRTRLDLPAGWQIVLFAGKLVPAKQPRELLEAFMAIGRPKTALVFVGEGPEKAGLMEHAQSRPDAAVHFLPFANQSEMPAHLLLADVLVLPSRGHYETWGLVVNEAMHLGVPCLVSELVGCQRDLVTDGETGWVFPSYQPAALRLTLARALDDLANPGRREQLRASVLSRISHYTYAQTTAGLMAALALNSRRLNN